MKSWLIVLAFVGSALGGLSPHADLASEILKQGRYSDDLWEDARMDVPDLVRKYGYPLEVHNVQTEDGYILGVHRIPHGRHSSRAQYRPVVFVMHGLMSSSADWVLMGPGKGLGYILADAGFDVWMGNARGNYYSRRHVTHDPDKGPRFWQFSWHEIGHIDLAAMVDEALEMTQQSQLHYIGHSQGTTTFFVLTTTKPDYNAKMKSMHAFGPIAFVEYLYSPPFRLIARYMNSLEIIYKLLGRYEVAPNTEGITAAGEALCRDSSIFQPICVNIFFLVCGYNVEQLNTTMMPVILGHGPAGASINQLIHYGQGIQDGHFRQFDHGPFRNLLKYGTLRPPNYDLGRITAPVVLYYGDNDWMADIRDVERLYRGLGNPIGMHLVDGFNHIDFMWAIDAKTLLYDRAISMINDFESKHILINEH